MKIIDISQELFTCHVFPGDTPPQYERVKTIDPDLYNLTNITMCVHNGTHVDAPKHFVADGKSIDELDLSVFYGKCTVVEVSGLINEETMKDILQHSQERLILKGTCELSNEAVHLLTFSHVKLIGVESQTVGNPQEPRSIHVALLQKSIIPLEGLHLSAVTPGDYILCAFPLALGGSDGSPVRAVLLCE
ncbi:MAG: cyclase family protein [Lachnospiraceae bacterium]|jgi:arylformamidase|nr:cyclase family protein [Lachnospiraceae bacterium]